MELKQLCLVDFGLLIGVDFGKGMKKSVVCQVDDWLQLVGKVLLVDCFEIDKWQVMDVDVCFKGWRIEYGGILLISDLLIYVILEDGDLCLQLVCFGLVNGLIVGSVYLQGDKKLLQGEVNLQV